MNMISPRSKLKTKKVFARKIALSKSTGSLAAVGPGENAVADFLVLDP